MNRTPPKDVLRKLRKEVGFACPVCASPFLTWHHFDPVWKVKQHHNPFGMIALCPEHAAHADGGHYTVAQMRNYKKPLEVGEIISAKWPWQPEKALVILGNFCFLGSRPILTIQGRMVFGIRRSALPPSKIPFFSFQVDFRGGVGERLLEIDENIIYFYGAGLTDIICPPQARFFELTYGQGERLKVTHKRLLLADALKDDFLSSVFSIYLESHSLDSLISLLSDALDSEGKIPVIEVEGDIKSKNVDLALAKSGSKMVCKFYRQEVVNLKTMFFYAGGSFSFKNESEELIRFG